MYKETSISKLVDRSTQIGENKQFSEAVTEVVQKNKWSKGTIYTVMASIRKILKETAISDSFIDTIKVIQPHKEQHAILGKNYTMIPSVPSWTTGFRYSKPILAIDRI